MFKKFSLLFLIFSVLSVSLLFADYNDRRRDTSEKNEKALDQGNSITSEGGFNSSLTNGAAGASVGPAKAAQDIYEKATEAVENILKPVNAKNGTPKMSTLGSYGSKPVATIFKLFLTFFYLLSLSYFVLQKFVNQKTNYLALIFISIKVIVCVIIFSQLWWIPKFIVSLAQKVALFLVGANPGTEFKIIHAGFSCDAAVGFWLAVGLESYIIGNSMMIAPMGIGLTAPVPVLAAMNAAAPFLKEFGFAWIATAVFAIIGGGTSAAMYASFCFNLYLGSIIAVLYLPATLFGSFWQYDTKAVLKFFVLHFVEVFIMTFMLLILRSSINSSGMWTNGRVGGTNAGSLLFFFPAMLPIAAMTLMTMTTSVLKSFIDGAVAATGESFMFQRNFSTTRDGNMLKGMDDSTRAGWADSGIDKRRADYDENSETKYAGNRTIFDNIRINERR